MVPDWLMMVDDGSMSVVRGFEGFRLVFHFSRSVFMFFSKVPGCFFGCRMFFYGFSRFPVGFS